MISKPIISLLQQMINLQAENNNILIKSIEKQKTTPEEDVWLHTEDVMQLFKKCKRTIFNWRDRGVLESKIVGGTVFYLRSDVYKILNKE